MNILFIGILVVNIAIFAVLFVAFHKTQRTYDALRAEFRAFITPGTDSQGEASASPLATITLALADQAARSVVASLKASFMGQASGQVRFEKSAEAEAQLDMIGAVNPGLGALIQGIPALRKIAKKNPALLDAAIARFAGGNGSAGATPTISSSSNQSIFNI